MRPAIYAVVVLLVAACSLPEASGARILGLLGFSGKSHNHGFGALAAELARRGHELTVLTPFPTKNPPGKYRQIDAPLSRQMLSSFNQMDHAKQTLVEKLNFFWSMAGQMCPQLLNSPEVKELLNEQFDLVIVSIFFNDCFIPFAYHNKAPLILYSPAGLLSWVSENLGNPEPTAFVPNLFLPFSHDMRFHERVINTLVSLMGKFMRNFVLIPKMDAVSREFYGQAAPPILELERNASLTLINSHVSLNYPRPLLPNIVEVGGLHLEPSTTPLPKDLQDFMDGAKHGVIYFSMGSVVRPEDFPPEMIASFIETFQSLQQRVIWKWNLDTLPGQPANVKLGKWLPQQDILAHPNLRLFITHGGLLSTQEAAFHGVPLVGIPVLGDQQLNVRQSELIGFAVGVDFHNVSRQSLLPAIERVLNTPSYREKARTLKKRVRDQPETPLERAVFWTEYILRHDGAEHLRPASSRLAWWQLYLLDVIGTLAILLLLLAIALRAALRACCGGKKNKSTEKRKKRE